MPGRFTFTIDSTEPTRIVPFWAETLGYSSVGEFGSFWPLFPLNEGEPVLIIQQVQEEKSGKNRMHMDIHVPDLEAEIERLLALGASPLSGLVVEHDHRWVVMADPDGNEFCVVQRPTS